MTEELHMNLETADVQNLDDKAGNRFTVVVWKIKRINP
jgi:hypothetical protein